MTTAAPQAVWHKMCHHCSCEETQQDLAAVRSNCSLTQRLGNLGHSNTIRQLARAVDTRA